MSNEIIKEIAEAVKVEIENFASVVDGLPVEVVRKYHDPTSLAKGKVFVTVYPLTKQKSSNGRAGKQSIVSIYVAIQRSLSPSDTDAVEAMITYREDLDDHFETAGKMGCGTHVINDDEQPLWFPKQLHQKNRFVSLLALDYSWVARRGGAS